MSIYMFSLEQVCKGTRYVPRWGISPLKASSLHDVLRQLVTILPRDVALEDMLHALADLTRQALSLDLCLILLRDPVCHTLHLRTNLSALHEQGVEIEPVHIDQALWARLCDGGQLPQLTIAELDRLNPLRNVQCPTMLPVPLLAGAEQIGLLNCYCSRPWQGTSDELLMLSTIVNQAALAIKYRLCLEEQAQAQKTSVKAFMEDLFSVTGEESLQRRAYLLGYDLTWPHVVAVIELSDPEVDWRVQDVTPEERRTCVEALSNRLQQNVQVCYPGSLVEERDNLLVCLFRLGCDSTVVQISSWLDDMLRHLGREWHVCIAAGIGNICYAVADYLRGLAEASEALKLNQLLKRTGNCTHFNDLGAYRYLYRFAHEDTLGDQYQDQVAAIIAYDQRKKTALLDTLETYLECGGSVARTSLQLEVHRNTLLQRIERLQKLCTFDLERVQHRFPLLAAIKIYRLRAS